MYDKEKYSDTTENNTGYQTAMSAVFVYLPIQTN